MSLKSFHVVFITASSVLAAGFGLWAISVGGPGYVIAGAGSLVVSAALVVYESAFLRKCRALGLE